MKTPRSNTFPWVPAALVLGLGTASAAYSVSPAVSSVTVQETAQVKSADDAAERFIELEDEATDAINSWARANRARRDPKSDVEDPGPDPRIAYTATFMGEAAKYAGTDGAVPFLQWVVASGSSTLKSEVASALGTLAESHATSPQLAEKAWSLTRAHDLLGTESYPHLDAIRTKSEDPVVKGWASFARFHNVLTEGDITSPEFIEAKALVEPFVKAAEDDRLNHMFGSDVSARVEFALGAKAPDIEGVDLSGTAFKLSDYDGKIIFLDFWGNW